MDLTWLGLHHRDVSGHQMHDLLRLRHQVFVVEQECPWYTDIDGLDTVGATHHVLGLGGDRVLATARIIEPGVLGDQARIGRVVVDPQARGAGAAHVLMGEALLICSREWPEHDLMLSAQAHLQEFYQAHGFSAVGEIYVEDDIDHVDMLRPH